MPCHASQIAEENGLKSSALSAAEVTITSKAQNDESDLVFLRATANDNGFICTVKDNVIILSPMGGEEEAAGASASLPSVTVDITACTSLRLEKAAKTKYGSVTLEWQDLDSGTIESVEAGEGAPVYFLRGIQPKSPLEAKSMATGKLRELNKGAVSGTLSILGGVYLRAGGKLTLTGIEDGGVYDIANVSHNLTTTDYTINVDFK